MILAAAGLRRLGLDGRVSEWLEVKTMVPAVGQGILGLEHREGESWVGDLLAPLGHPDTDVCARAERALLASLGAGCTVPLGGHATVAAGQVQLQALLVDPASSVRHQADGEGPREEAELLGRRLGHELLAGPARAALGGR